MTKYFLTCIITIVSSWLVSCNAGNDSDKKNSSGSGDSNLVSKNQSGQLKFGPGANCIGLANIFFLNQQDALNMITHFKDEFHNKPGLPATMRKLKDSIWIDASVIKGFSDFLSANSKDYDGLRIVMGAYSNDSSCIFLVTTTANGTGHRERWDAYVPVTSASKIEFRNFNIDEAIARPLVDSFTTRVRKQTNPHDINSTSFDSLSTKIWLNSCVFSLLSDTIETSGNKLDGVMVYFAAYNKIVPNRASFQKKPNQSTMILVPTIPNGPGKHKADWDAVRVKFVNLKFTLDPGGYNHGELCPQICN